MQIMKIVASLLHNQQCPPFPVVPVQMDRIAATERRRVTSYERFRSFP